MFVHEPSVDPHFTTPRLGSFLQGSADRSPVRLSAKRMLKPVGRIAFTVPHSCFDAPGASTITWMASPRY